MRWRKNWAARASSSMHATVLLQEAVDSLNLKKGDIAIDGTLGAGGHSEEIARRFGADVKVIALDLDSDAIARAGERLHETPADIEFNLENFKNLDVVLGNRQANAILLDLGWSSDQFETSGRGFSFQRDEPLVMTLKRERDEEDFTAADIINTWDEEDIANVLYGYGEERFARRIAREIVETREREPIATTADLVKVVMNAVPFFYRRGRIHPATKTFQALRIAVNGELQNLTTALEKGLEALAPGGRFAIISFHSLEDRIVKNFFRDAERDGRAKLITKKPLAPTPAEIAENPRSRSAKLRVIEKL